VSVRVISQVLEASAHAGSELLMLVVLADYSDDAGNSYPAVPSLARKCRMSPRNANYILAALQASGELRVLKNEGPRGTNRYRIMLDQLGKQPLQAASALKPVAPLKPASPPPPEEGCTPEAAFTLKPTSATPEAGFPKPLKPTSDEPPLNRQEPSSSPRKRVSSSAAIKLPECVPADAWADFVEMRKAIRKPMTAKAKHLCLLKLVQLRDSGHDPRAVLEQSVVHSWADLYRIKPEQRGRPGGSASGSGQRSPFHADDQLA
jgi:hypothetical protein